MKLRFVVLLAALVLLVVVVGWFLAGNPGASVEGIQTADRQSSSHSVPVPPTTDTTIVSPPQAAAPIVQNAPPAPVPSQTAPAPGPTVLPMQSPAQPQRPMTPSAMPAPARAAAQASPVDSSPPSAISPEAAAAAALDMDRVNLMFRDFRTRMGVNPVGTNAEIMKAVMGDNPKRARLGPPEGQSLNGNGELVDRWGTPYFFHQMSATHMEIRSAGPDKIFSTQDDVTQF